MSTKFFINSLNYNFGILFLFLTIFQYYSMALYIINPQDLIEMKQANDNERDKIELEARWRLLQRALKGRLNNLIEKERFVTYSLLPFEEQKNEIIRNKRQPQKPSLIFFEPELKEEYENNENGQDDDFIQENEDNIEENPLLLVVKQKPEIEGENEFIGNNNNNLLYLPSWSD